LCPLVYGFDLLGLNGEDYWQQALIKQGKLQPRTKASGFRAYQGR